MKPAARMESIPASATIAVTVKAAALKAAGHDVIGFGAGQPDFDTPQHIIDAAKRALDDGWTRYTPTPGLPQLRQAVCQHFARDFNMEITPDQVITSCGGKHSLYNAMMALVNPGDGVLLPAPYWVTYPVQIEMADGIVQRVPTLAENDFLATIEGLEAACDETTKGLILNSPSNPTGSAYKLEQLQAIAEFVTRKNLWVVADEMYAKLTYDGFEHHFFASLPGMFERTLTVYGLSKTYAMTGWRVGIAVAPKEMVSAMARMQGQVTTNTAAMAQAGAIAALTEPEDFLPGWLEAFSERRNIMVGRLNGMDGVRCDMPDGAFYAFPDLRGLLGRKFGDKVMSSDWDLIDYLLEEAGVALVPGTPFGAPGFARLSYAISKEQIVKGMDRMERAFGALT
jgi:aspartate aminotransferase